MRVVSLAALAMVAVIEFALFQSDFVNRVDARFEVFHNGGETSLTHDSRHVVSSLESYGTHEGYVFGTARGGVFFIASADGGVTEFSNEHAWRAALAGFGVRDATLLTPSRLRDSNFWYAQWLLGAVLFLGPVWFLALSRLKRAPVPPAA